MQKLTDAFNDEREFYETKVLQNRMLKSEYNKSIEAALNQSQVLQNQYDSKSEEI